MRESREPVRGITARDCSRRYNLAAEWLSIRGPEYPSPPKNGTVGLMYEAMMKAELAVQEACRTGAGGTIFERMRAERMIPRGS